MAYYLNLFTPQTWEAFRRNGSKISGFGKRQLTTAKRLKLGDISRGLRVRHLQVTGLVES
jgi:hypothetical protein